MRNRIKAKTSYLFVVERKFIDISIEFDQWNIKGCNHKLQNIVD